MDKYCSFFTWCFWTDLCMLDTKPTRKLSRNFYTKPTPYYRINRIVSKHLYNSFCHTMQSLVLSLDQLVLLSVPYNASITSVANSVQHVMGPISTLFLSQDLQSSGVRYSLICFSQPIHNMEQFARQWEFTDEYTFQDPWCMENNLSLIHIWRCRRRG